MGKLFTSIFNSKFVYNINQKSLPVKKKDFHQCPWGKSIMSGNTIHRIFSKNLLTHFCLALLIQMTKEAYLFTFV